MRLSQLQRNEETRDVALDFGDAGTVNIVVYPNKRNLGYQRRLKAAQDDNDIARMADIFFSTVKSWDVTDDDDKVMPFTPETIDQLGMETFIEIGKKLSEHLNPNPETSTS